MADRKDDVDELRYGSLEEDLEDLVSQLRKLEAASEARAPVRFMSGVCGVLVGEVGCPE